VNQPRVRVVYLAHALMVGGAEEMVLSLVRHLPARFEPVVVCINQSGPIGDEIRAAGVPLHVLGLTPGIAHPFDILRLRDFLFALEPQIVHTFLLTASLYGRLAAMLAGVPIVIGSEVNIYERKRPLHAIAERWLMRWTDAVVTSAEAVREFYVRQIGTDRSKVEVIYNAVDWTQLQVTMGRDEMRTSSGIPRDVPLAGILARLTEQKAHRVLFEALARTPALANMHLAVAGTGELRDELERRAAALGLEQRVHFLGVRRDVGNVLGALDMFVLPSLWEGLPLALVLAMGAGLPVVATAVAGVPEVVAHGERGLLVNPGDAAGLGAALARLLTNPQEGRELGDAARAFVRPRFGADVFTQSTIGLYDRLRAAKGLA
jgi:glycosyltransferase involved in cell wall biosynthesis